MQTLESVTLTVKVFVKLCPKPLLSKLLYHVLRGLMVEANSFKLVSLSLNKGCQLYQVVTS